MNIAIITAEDELNIKSNYTPRLTTISQIPDHKLSQIRYAFWTQICTYRGKNTPAGKEREGRNRGSTGKGERNWNRPEKFRTERDGYGEFRPSNSFLPPASRNAASVPRRKKYKLVFYETTAYWCGTPEIGNALLTVVVSNGSVQLEHQVVRLIVRVWLDSNCIG